MSAYNTKLPDPLRKLLRDAGYSPNAEIVVSASGSPIPTAKDGQRFLEDAQANFQTLYEIVQRRLRMVSSRTGTSVSSPGSVRFTAV